MGIIMTVKDLTAKLDAHKARSAWERGVTLYAYELLENLAECAAWTHKPARISAENMLNGAKNWKEFSWGGSSLIYDSDIAKRLCAPWELRKTDNGAKRPNAREEWLDTQARALFQACELLKKLAWELADECSRENFGESASRDIETLLEVA